MIRSETQISSHPVNTVNPFWHRLNLKNRLALVTIVTITLLVLGIIVSVITVLSRQYTNVLALQQQTLMEGLAKGIDDQLEASLHALAGVAQVTPPEALTDRLVSQRFLDNRTGIQSIFDNGLVLFDRTGQLIAETPHNPERTIWDASSYPFFKQAVSADKPIISQPFKSTKKNHLAVVQFLAPVKDINGTTIGYLCGGLSLQKQNFLGTLASRKMGKSGYLYLYSRDRTMLVHPDPTRVLAQNVPPGVNKLFDKAITGWSGSGTTVNSLGVKQIASFMPLTQAPWILAATFPAQEAYEPLRTTSILIILLAVGIGTVGGSVSWFTARRLTGPLADLATHLQRLPQLAGEDRFLKPGGGPELEVLATSFNMMITNLDSVSEDHHKTAQLLKLITDNVPDLIWAKDLQHRYIFTNKANNDTLLFSKTPEEPIGKTHDYFSGPEIAAHPDDPNWYHFSDMCAASDDMTVASEESMRFQEYGFVRGKQVCLDVYKAPFYDLNGNLVGTVGSARIITREKQLELEAQKLDRMYRVLSVVNQKIVHKPSSIELFQCVCDALVNNENFIMAWVGLPDGSGGYFPAVAAGISLDQVITLHGSDHFVHLSQGSGKNNIITAITSDNAQAILCYSCYGLYQVMPFSAEGTYLIQPDQALPAQLVVYATEGSSFDADRQALLEKLIADLAYALDMSEQEAQQEHGRRQLQLAAAVFENSSEGVIVTDPSERILMVNKAFTTITGYTFEEVQGQTPRLLKSNRHGRDFYQSMWASLEATGLWRGEIWGRRKCGEIYPELLSISTVRGAEGEINNYVAVFNDISKTRDFEQRLDYLSWHDPLTDLPNRQMASLLLDQSIARVQRSGHILAVLCLDLDHFKDVNDSFGHLTGDALLRLVSQRLRQRVRAADTVARLGGDEFAVLLENLDDPTAVAIIAADIMSSIQEPFYLENGVELRTSFSIGISLYPDHGQTSVELLQKADSALFRAKQAGRSGFAFFTEELTTQALERIHLGNRLRCAVEQNELRVVYQPQVDMATDRIVGAEALLRWHSPEFGLVSPVRFIPLAEKIGCICALGEWILRQTCLQGRAWLDAGLPPLTLAVNLSPHQFHQNDIQQVVANVLDETGFPAQFLELEVTESALMQPGNQSIMQLQELRGLGVKLALDDFGTGYSSLSYLKHFPLNVLKIDKSFVDDIPHDAKDMRLVNTIILMAKGMGFKVLAEGVERQEQLDTLKKLHCDLYQGYIKSKPLEAEAFKALLAQDLVGK